MQSLGPRTFMKKFFHHSIFQKFSILVILLAPNLSFAGPPDSALTPDGKAFVIRAREFWNKPKDWDVEAGAEERVRLAQEGLRLNPNSQKFKRDLADAFHTLGHMAEATLDFEKAIALHKESLSLFRQSPDYSTQESFDGEIHALEHIYQALFDAALHWERLRNYSKAGEYYDRSLEFFKLERLLQFVAPNGIVLNFGRFSSSRIGLRFDEYLTNADPKTSSMRPYLSMCKTLMKSYKTPIWSEGI